MTYHPVGYTPSPIWTPPRDAVDVWFDAPNKERLHGWFFSSQKQPAVATVLHAHGNGGNLTNVGWFAAALADRGFDVLVFDYRGYGRSEGKLSDEWALFSDGDAAYDYLVRERRVKPESIVLYGQSLGTTVAIDVAARRPVAMLIVESGLSSASDMAATVFPWLPRWLHRLGRNRFESVRKLKDVHCPVLVIHGEKDQTIPAELGRRLFDAANEPKLLEIVADGDHNLIGNGGHLYVDRVAGFIQRVLLERQVVPKASIVERVG